MLLSRFKLHEISLILVVGSLLLKLAMLLCKENIEVFTTVINSSGARTRIWFLSKASPKSLHLAFVSIWFAEVLVRLYRTGSYPCRFVEVKE
ncbi:hypothetical protein POPTR_001G357150v4 [Populus trichocarpa]|uniref:Uncharacterized protein n=1 Tax=Populus trichocarpa TaxID=3694 RepID=A0ACC0TN43_POPTR|nr:hypothetical protein POPTR_001G357150v4 [Populus trichocarpa]